MFKTNIQKITVRVVHMIKEDILFFEDEERIQFTVLQNGVNNPDKVTQALTREGYKILNTEAFIKILQKFCLISKKSLDGEEIMPNLEKEVHQVIIE